MGKRTKNNEICVPHTREFHSVSFEQSCASMGIEIVFPAFSRPLSKGNDDRVLSEKSENKRSRSKETR
jgi:hypothetical protein